MENTRLLLAIGLSFLVFFLWSLAFGPKPEEPIQENGANQTQESPSTGLTATPMPPIPADAQTPSSQTAEIVEDQPAVAAHPARTIVVDTPLYTMTLSEKGATVTSLVLKEYRETVAEDSPFKELVDVNLKNGTVQLSIDGLAGNGLKTGLYTLDDDRDSIQVTNEPVVLRFTYASASDIQVEKVYRFVPDSYLTDLSVQIHNNSGKPFTGAMKLALLDPAPEKSVYGFLGPSGLINDTLEQVKVKKIEDQGKKEGTIQWVGIERLYFMDSLISKQPVEGAMTLALKDNIIENQMVVPVPSIAPGSSHIGEFALFMGPKSISVLKSAGYNLPKAIYFGWVDIIAKPCLYFMNFIHRYIPNYGIAIIILTLISRLIFWPLAQKSYKSMNDMRKVQPLMQEIREKYKDDKVRLNQETMALYRTYKINPLGGCLPMLIQLPVFFALYRMLYQAIELRHAPFFGWINDLSAPDRLFDFGFKIPFMEAPYGIPVLTLIMGATMLLQQKMSPAPGDPTQAKMMMLMPVVFTVIFINFPSGLVLYWLFSNLVSVAQQYFTQKRLA